MINHAFARSLFTSLSFFLMANTALAETHEVVVVDGSGKLFTIKKEGRDKFSIIPAEQGILKNSSFTVPSGELLSIGGKTRITNNGLGVEMDSGFGWSDSGLTPPPGSLKYSRAHLDTKGDAFVELSTGGFNYVPQGRTPIVARNMTFVDRFTGAQVAVPTFDAAVGNPYGAGFIAKSRSGELVLVEPPTQPRGPFTVTKLADAGEVHDVGLHQGHLVITKSDGNMSILKSAEPLGKSEVPLTFPDGFKPDKAKFFISPGVERHQEVRSAQVAAVAPPPVAVTPGNQGGPQAITPPRVSLLPKGHKIEYRDGKLEQIDTSGMVVKRPPSVLSPLDGHKQSGMFLEGIGYPDGVHFDEVALDRHLDQDRDVFGRRDEANRVLDILVREKGKNPVLVGEPGVGKTAIAQLIQRMIMDANLPDANEYQRVLKDAVVVETTPARLSKLAMADTPTAQASAIEGFIKSLKAAEDKLGKRIILYVDEMHTFSKDQLEALKTSLDSHKGILFIGSTTHAEFGQMIGRNGALERRLQTVPVREFTAAETKQLLKDIVVPRLERKYDGAQGHGKITDEAIDAAIKHAIEYLPRSSRPEGPYKLLQDAMIAAHRAAGTSSPTLQPHVVGGIVKDALGLPFDPTDSQAVIKGTNELRDLLRKKIVDNPQIADAMSRLVRDMYLAPPDAKKHRVLLLTGPTGAGKTFSGRTLAKNLFGTEDRFLEIDGTQFQNGGVEINSLLGSPPGTVDSEFKGELPEFLDGKGKGASVIVINEVDKMHPEAFKSIMELMDTGKFTRHGKTYHAGRAIFVLTSNKGAEYIYPRDLQKPMAREELKRRIAGISKDQVKKWFLEPDPNNLYNKKNVLPPEVVNRFDEAVAAAPPSREGAIEIAKDEMKRHSTQLYDGNGFRIHFDDKTIERIVEAHYVPENGVRDLVRAVETLFNNTLASTHIERTPEKDEVITVELAVGKPGEGDRYVLKSDKKKRDTTLEAPNPSAIANPLLDPTVRDLLTNLETRLGSHVFGQPEAIKMASEALRNKKANVLNPRPATMLLLGPTGNGKTELAKAIAREYYGDETKLKLFDMGKVKWEGHMNQIFGSDEGFVGSDKVSQFERFLMQHPEGGVIVFDEVGNMGGGKTVNAASGSGANTKTELLQMFYSMLDEGKFVSKQSHKTYDLRKYTIVFTSNEGQEAFQGLPTDDLRMSVWKKEKSQERLVEMLKKEGWPEALLGRLLGRITLYKPLLEAEREHIAKKLVDKALDQLKAQHGIKSWNIENEFYRHVADSFFSHSTGARSIDKLAQGGLVDLLTKGLLDKYDPEKLQNSHFNFTIEDNYRGRHSYEGDLPPDRKVTLKLTITEPGGAVRHYNTDMSDQAAEKRLTRMQELIEVAAHEAGHAIVNDPRLTGMVTDFITVKSAGGYGGYARYEDKLKKGNLTREEGVAVIGRALAGNLGQRAIGVVSDSGWSADLEQARKMAEQMVGAWGLTDASLRLPTSGGKVNINSPAAQKEIRKLLAEGEKYAMKRIKERWPLFQLVMKELIDKGNIDGARYGELERKAVSAEYVAELKRSNQPDALTSPHVTEWEKQQRERREQAKQAKKEREGGELRKLAGLLDKLKTLPGGIDASTILQLAEMLRPGGRGTGDHDADTTGTTGGIPTVLGGCKNPLDQLAKKRR